MLTSRCRLQGAMLAWWCLHLDEQLQTLGKAIDETMLCGMLLNGLRTEYAVKISYTLMEWGGRGTEIRGTAVRAM